MTFLIKNKSLLVTIVSLFVNALLSHSQNIKVINKVTKATVSGVAIYNKNKTQSQVTNLDGEAHLDQFKNDEILYFQHINFQKKVLKKAKIINSTILLTPNTQDLDEIVISASKFEQTKRDIPKKIASVSAKTIAFTNPQTSADLLESTGQVYVQKSQLGGGSPIIRGFSTNRLLITVDGVRMNNAIFRSGNLQNVISVDPFSVENTEVILGAASVIYGSDAIGGVMGFYTKKPKLSLTDSLHTETNAVLRYATASEEKTAHIGINLGYKKWGLLTNASYTDFNDLRMGKNGPDAYLRPEFVITNNNIDTIVKNRNPLLQRFSGYNQINIMQKALYQPKENLSFNLGVFYTASSDVPRYDRLIRPNDDGQLRSAEWLYGPQRWFMANLNSIKLSSRSNLYDKINFNAAYQKFNESRIDRNFQSLNRRVREEKVDALSFNLDFEKKITNKTKLFYGLEYVYNTINSEAQNVIINTGNVENAVTRYPDGSSWQSSALYTSIKYKPNTKLVFQSGLRYNIINSKADFEANNVFLNLPFNETKNNSDALTGTAGITWLLNEQVQWKFNLGTAFRAPNIDDIGKVFDSEPGSVVVPNENLKPEYAYNGDLGLRLNFGKTFTIDTGTYYTYLDNALVRRNGDLNGLTQIIYDGELSNVQSVQNASKAWIYGFEIGAKLQFNEALKFTSQYNIIGGTEETDTVEVPARHVAPNFGNAHLIWKKNKLQADAFINFNGTLSSNQLAPSELGKAFLYALDDNGDPFSPSWYTLNLRTQYQLNKMLLLTSSVENITDQRYRTYSSGISAPGRNLILSLKYNL